MKLHLNTPDSDKIISAIMRVLHYPPQFIHDEDNCNETVDSFVYNSVPADKFDRAMKDIALLAYGNDTESAVNRLAVLRLIGTGKCPVCGSNRIREHYEHFGMFKCQTCLSDFEDEKFMVSYNGVNYWQ